MTVKKPSKAAKSRKKQRTRLIKCICPVAGCGYNVRVTRKWIDDPGPPHCPLHGAMVCVVPQKPEK